MRSASVPRGRARHTGAPHAPVTHVIRGGVIRTVESCLRYGCRKTAPRKCRPGTADDRARHARSGHR